MPELTPLRTQVKSKDRVNRHGEVFTGHREVKAIIDLIALEANRIDSRFLEPACGDGNFLSEVLKRKLDVVLSRYRRSQIEFERYSIIAVSGLYGVDILEDNASECRQRLFTIFDELYTKLYKNKCKETCRNSVRFVLSRNIQWGDALDYSNPETKRPLIFSEWSAVNGSLIKRTDYVFRFLVEETSQFRAANDEGKDVAIDEPINSFPLQHFLTLGDNDSSEL